MGTICILLGVICLFAFTGLGFFAANEIVQNELYMTLLDMKDPNIVYVVVVGACAFIGLLICLNLVMHGSNANKLNKISKMLKHHKTELKEM